jgi:hypothetical protein
MTKPMRASEVGLEPHWKIRIIVGGAILHVASGIEPTPLFEIDEGDGCRVLGDHVLGLKGEWIDDHEYGDTLGYIDWDALSAATWRYSP